MQHYGLPTRLLDWSESPLVALYFAVNEQPSIPGAIWGLATIGLNEEETTTRSLFMANNELVIQQLKDITNPITEKTTDYILAIPNKEFDIRHIMQQSVFTIHGRANPINKIENNSKFLVKYEIPAELKNKLLVDLRSLGISETFLFPDLEHLASDIKNRNFAK